MNYLLTLDVGTTSVKTCLFSDDFRLVASASGEYRLLTPGKDLVELDPSVYWEACKTGISRVIGRSGIKPGCIGAITITTQGETLIPVDRDGTALHNAVVWLDGRAVEETALIQEQLTADEFYRNTGLPEISPACPISKVLWFKRQRPDVFQKTYKFMLLEDFLIHRLTGEFVTDQSLMSSTGYLQINTGQLWKKTLDVIGVDESYFPAILRCGQIVGHLKPNAADELGLECSTVVTTGAMDQICSALGAGNIMPGVVTETTGTALVAGATAIRPDFDNPAKVPVYRHYDDKYIILPYCPTAGMVLKWFKDEFCESEARLAEKEGISVYKIIDRMAESAKAAENGLLMLTDFSGRLSPDVNPNARGVFFGVGLDTKKEHFIRAIMEAIGFMLRENLELIEAVTGTQVREVRSLGGGASSRLWSTIKADICGRNIITMNNTESTSLGAAMLGAMSTGLYSNMDEICAGFIKPEQTFVPDMSRKDMYDKAFSKYKSLYACLKELF